MTLPVRFARHLESLDLPAGTRVLAVSGGPDSMALLQLMARLLPPTQLLVAHVDHGIHPDSPRVAALVERAAARLGVLCLVTRLGLGPGVTETEAREARYQALRAIADERDGLIVTAHHRDDQIETVLMRVLGGSGLAGLAAMQPVAGGIVRPLLPFSRSEILAWVSGAGIEFWDDPANADPTHLRSWLRHQIIAPLVGRIPDLDRRLTRLARRARESRVGWDQVLGFLGLDVRTEPEDVSLLRQPLAGFTAPLASQVIQAAARRAGFRVGPAAATRLVSLLRTGDSGQRVDLGRGLVGEIVFDRVVLRPGQAVPQWEAVQVTGDEGQAQLGSWQCRWRPERAPPRQERRSWTAWVAPGSYRIRPWHHGDRIDPLGGRGHRLVVRCMQDARVPWPERAAWPVVVADQRVVWVPGVMRGADAVPSEGAAALRLDLKRN